MATIMDYIDAFGEEVFDKMPPSEVDYVIMSQLAHVDYSFLDNKNKATLRQAAQNIGQQQTADDCLGLIIPRDIMPMFRLAAQKPRYRDIVVGNYTNLIDEGRETHFAALTLDFARKKRAVVFCGTRDTIIGWKENFLMIYRYPVTAQVLAQEFLQRCCAGYSGKVWVVGHSKGGNLAMYAAAAVDRTIQKKIENVYSFDAPGFSAEFYHSPKFLNIADKVCEIVPQNAVIGKLFEHSSVFKVVKSGQVGLYQHDCFSWEVDGGGFVYMDDIEEAAKNADLAVKDILSALNEEQRKLLVESLFSLFSTADCHTLTELSHRKRSILKNYTQLKGEPRKLLIKVFLQILTDKTLRKLLADSVKEMLKQKKQEVKTSKEDS